MRTRAASNFEDEDEDHKIEEFAHPSTYTYVYRTKNETNSDSAQPKNVI